MIATLTTIVIVLGAAVAALGAILAALAADCRQLRREAQALAFRARAANRRAARWQAAVQAMQDQMTADVATAQAVAITQEHRVLPAPADLDQVERELFAEIVASCEDSDA